MPSPDTTKAPDSAFVAARLVASRPSVLATLLRIARRIEEGFEGEVIVAVKRGGVHFIRWTQTETGDTIKEELG